MRRFSEAWFQAIENSRFCGEWSSDRGPKLPTLCWMTHPLPPVLRQFICRHGTREEHLPGESLFPTTQVTDFLYVERGLTGRIASTLDGQSGSGAMAMSAPHRLAAGNLNWITHRPAIGRYVTLSHAVIYRIAHVQMAALLEEAPREILWALLTHIEYAHLSDRLGFSLLALQSSEVRWQALLLAWAVYFGVIANEPGKGDVVTMPVPGRRRHIQQVIGVSSVTLDKLVAAMTEAGEYARLGEFIRIKASVLQTAHDWMRHGDGDGVLYPRPARVEDLLYGAQEGLYD